jgi:hypothetical protein
MGLDCSVGVEEDSTGCCEASGGMMISIKIWK